MSFVLIIRGVGSIQIVGKHVSSVPPVLMSMLIVNTNSSLVLKQSNSNYEPLCTGLPLQQ